MQTKRLIIYLFLLFILSMFSLELKAQVSVTGNVVDINDAPLIGVNVVEKGTSNGTITDAEGRFSINVSSDAVLSFSYIGFITQEIAITTTTLRVILYEDTELLEEVVVVGYGTQSKRNVSGAISSVRSEDIIRSTSTSLSGALAGKVQGITTRASDARPGRGVNLQIRNMGNPLYVIDGVPYGGITGADAFGMSQGSGEDIFNQL